MGFKRLDNLNLVIIDMVLKRTKCDLKDVKIAIFAAKLQKSPAGGGSAPL